MSFLKPVILLSTALWFLLAPLISDAHEGAHDAPPDYAAPALSCAGVTAFLPDTARGEGSMLLIVENLSDWQIRVRGPKIFKSSEPLQPKHCLKRFIGRGERRFTLTAYRLRAYPWLKPLKEWFAVGETQATIGVPDNTAAVLVLKIENDDIRVYDFGRYLRENWFKLFSVIAIYFLTFLAIAALALAIAVLKNCGKEARQ